MSVGIPDVLADPRLLQRAALPVAQGAPAQPANQPSSPIPMAKQPAIPSEATKSPTAQPTFPMARTGAAESEQPQTAPLTFHEAQSRLPATSDQEIRDYYASHPGRHPMDEKPDIIPRAKGAIPKTASAQADEANLARLQGSKPGVYQVHNPILKALGGIGDVIASGLFPGIGRMIPGTTAHHNMLVGGARQDVAADSALANAEQRRGLEAAQTENIEGEQPLHAAQAEEARAHAHAFLEPPDKEKHDVHAIFADAVKDAMQRGVEPMEDPKVKQALQAVLATQKEAVVPEAERPIANVDAINKALEDRWHVINKGPIPAQYQLKPGSTNNDFAHVDKMLESVERSTENQATHEESRKLREQSMAIAQGNRADTRNFQQQEVGRKLLDKAEAEYRTASQSADDLNAMIDSAKAGNKISAVASPLEGTLAIVTSQGIKRINRTEVENTAGAGSLWDRIQGKIGKLTSGQPIPPDLQEDWKKLAGLLKQGAYQKYQQAHQSAVRRYGLQGEEPLPAPVSQTAAQGATGFKAGDKQVKNGVTYVRDDKGIWHPQ